MRLLLDTHLLLWAAGAPERLLSLKTAVMHDLASSTQALYSRRVVAPPVSALPRSHNSSIVRIHTSSP